MLNGRLKAWGPQVFLEGAAVSWTRTGPNEIYYTQNAHSLLIHLNPDSGWQLAVNSARKRHGLVLAGAIDIIPSNNQLSANWNGTMQGLRVDIDPTRLRHLAGMELDYESFELQPPEFGFIDKRVHALALWIQQELRNGQAFSAEAVDAFVTLSAIHLLRSYSSLAGKPTASGGLPPSTLRRVKDFIWENSATSCAIEQLSSLAGLSPSHFLRAFKQSTGQAPHQFVMATRLAQARRLILADDMPLSLIATQTGFSSHSHMTAQMKRAWGTTPSQIRRKTLQ